ncbi:MAG: biopolymer transporter ExbD [Planctomycetales bacterium]|nr:biopolymer transporter ExbD [Planctomycetales bacterium]
MKFRHLGDPENEPKIELQMTPMIDIVFQLLVFFIMSFKITAQEGDFNIKMPLAAPNAGAIDDSVLPPLKLKLVADANGRLAANGIQLNERAFADFDGLHAYIRTLIGDQGGPGSVGEVEIEIDCDYQLQYRYTMAAVTAVSGYIDGNGNLIKLIDKIKFAPPQRPEGLDAA